MRLRVSGTGSQAPEFTLTDPVLIVGAGPTGLTAALELRFGVPVRIVDQADGPAATPRAFGIQAHTMELLEQRHLADEIARLEIRPATAASMAMASL